MAVIWALTLLVPMQTVAEAKPLHVPDAESPPELASLQPEASSPPAIHAPLPIAAPVTSLSDRFLLRAMVSCWILYACHALYGPRSFGAHVVWRGFMMTAGCTIVIQDHLGIFGQVYLE